MINLLIINKSLKKVLPKNNLLDGIQQPKRNQSKRTPPNLLMRYGNSSPSKYLGKYQLNAGLIYSPALLFLSKIMVWK